MGHWSTQFTAHTTDMHAPHQNSSHPPLEPCIFYVPHARVQTVVPLLQNGCSINYPHAPELRESAMNFGVPQINSIQPRLPPPGIDLNFPPPPGHYAQYLEPPSCIEDFAIQVSHGPLDSHGIGCIPMDSYCRALPYMDGIRGAFKRKSAGGIYGTFPYYNGAAAPNVAETGSYGVVRNHQPCFVGAETFMVHNTNQLMLGNFACPSVQIPGNHWLEMSYRANNDAAWRPPPLHYVHGEYIDPGNGTIQGFQVPVSDRSSGVFLRPPHLSHLNPHQPPPSMLAARDTGTANSASSGFEFYRDQGREITHDSSGGVHSFPHLRFLPEEETAMLELPGYHEPQDSVDRHRDMRLDIDHMSYEELLALGEHIGSVGTGLSEVFIERNLKTRPFTQSEALVDQQTDLCVICQCNYVEKVDIATLNCGHEYHSGCLKKWVLIKNTCPICKSTALSPASKNL